MTRIGVFSDSHGDRDALERLLEEMGHVDAACFLGDISSDAMFLREKLEELGGHKIWMEHGHLVPNLMTLAFRAKDHGADIALFGHTHEPLCEYAYGVMLLNPGSAGNRCRGGAARASLLLLDKDKIRVKDVL